MTQLAEHSADWLELTEKTVAVCTESDDCLDALMCALTARAVEIARVLPITDQARAADEGGIVLPPRESIPDLSNDA
jgi:hypothetical protein